MQRAPMTKAGSERLRAELEKLKSVERLKVIAAIAEARAHGDLSENAEYNAAREQQGFIEGRIQRIEAALSTAQIIDPATRQQLIGEASDRLGDHAEAWAAYGAMNAEDSRANIAGCRQRLPASALSPPH